MLTNFGSDLSETKYNPAPRDDANTLRLLKSLHVAKARYNAANAFYTTLADDDPRRSNAAIDVWNCCRDVENTRHLVDLSRGEFTPEQQIEIDVERHDAAQFGKHVLYSQLEG